MPKSKDNFIIVLKLKTNTNDEAVLSKRFRIAEGIYNKTLKYGLKQLKRMRENKEYKKTLNKYLLAKANNEEENIKTYSKLLNEIREGYNLSEYALHRFVKVQQNMYKKHIDSNTSQKIATTVWKAISDVLFNKGKKVHFKKFGQLSSLEGKRNTQGIRFVDNTLVWNGLKIKTKIRLNDLFVQESLLRPIKYSRIVRKPFKNGYKYFLQLILEGVPPIKRVNSNGEFRHKEHSSDRVGLDIGTSTIAICSSSEVNLIELAPNVKKYENEIHRLQRKLQRSRMSTNPSNFNVDDTVKRGIKLKWIRSKNYIKILFNLKNLYRLKTIYIKISHNKLSNYILTLGNTVFVEEMNFKALAKRSKITTINKKGKFNSKKRFGTSILNKAPSMLLTIIDRKLKYEGLKLNKVNTKTFKASQFNHVTNTFIKKKLKDRWNKINECLIQRDLYSSFLLMNSNLNLKTTNRELCVKTYDTFKINHDVCINNLNNNIDIKLKSSFGIKRLA